MAGSVREERYHNALYGWWGYVVPLLWIVAGIVFGGLAWFVLEGTTILNDPACLAHCDVPVPKAPLWESIGWPVSLLVLGFVIAADLALKYGVPYRLLITRRVNRGRKPLVTQLRMTNVALDFLANGIGMLTVWVAVIGFLALFFVVQ